MAATATETTRTATISRRGSYQVLRSSIIGPVKRYKLKVFADHSRDWQNNYYVYPVISRRSHGMSIGVNLNPDAACNFDCVYCQVDRSQPPVVRKVELDRLRIELDQMLSWAADGSIFTHPQFAEVPQELRRVNDIAFSGDGEPTTCPVFAEAVELAAELKANHQLDETKIVLITNACYLTKPKVVRGLECMDQNNGEIWAKLDAGTEEYFQSINRSNTTLDEIVMSIASAAKVRPVCIQSLFMNIDGSPPSDAEIAAYSSRLTNIVEAGGEIKVVQVHTVARKPTEAFVTSLSDSAIDTLAETITRLTGLPTARYYAA